MNAMTETEAHQKWCPMARIDTAGMNRNYPYAEPQHPVACCIASACMAWRWAPAATHISDIVRNETGKEWVEWLKNYRAETGADLHHAKRELERRFGGKTVPSNQGYCGAFGRPNE